MLLVLLLLLPGLKSEDPSPASGRATRNINNIWYEPVTFRLKEKTTKKGPVLFPNDGPPSPPTPLIVTSRPLIESIRRSELNPNNTIQDRASSQLNQVTFRPNYLDSDKEGNSFVYVPKPSPVYQFVNVPFEDLQARRQPNEKLLQGYVDNSEDYSSYYDTNQIGRDTANEYTQQRSTLPPIYKAFADHSNNELNRQKKLDALQKTKPVYEHQPRYENIRQNQNLGEANSHEYNQNQNLGEANSQEYNHGENYAFSYSVKDRQTGDDFSHSQRSSGSATNGEYRVRLPDGRMQIVSYTADEGGYKAEVRYDDDDTSKNKIVPEPVKESQYQNDYVDRYLDNRYTKYNQKTGNVPAVNSNYKVDDSFDVDYYNKAADRDAINSNDHTPDYLLTDHDSDKLDHDYKLISNIDYDRNAKQSNVPDSYQYSDEIVKDPIDYSSESLNYQPYKSKYSLFNANNGIKSTVTPAYEDIKHLFTTPNPAIGISATGNPYSTIEPLDSRTEKVVVIGTKKPLFTHIRNILGIGSVTPNPLSYSTQAPPVVSSPSSYLYSTISNLKNKIELAKKPILSQEYLNKINKYLQFN